MTDFWKREGNGPVVLPGLNKEVACDVLCRTLLMVGLILCEVDGNFGRIVLGKVLQVLLEGREVCLDVNAVGLMWGL